MSYVTVEVDIAQGRVTPREPQKLPSKGNGLLTILPSPALFAPEPQMARQKVELPLIQGDGKRTIDPTVEDLDRSLWGDQTT